MAPLTPLADREMTQKVRLLRKKLDEVGQQHLLDYFDELGDQRKRELWADLETLDLDRIQRLIHTYVTGSFRMDMPTSIEPAPFYPAEPADDDQQQLYDKAREEGRRLLKENKVAAFTVAGGMGTRLGFDGPKGKFKVTPVQQKPLFRVFAEFILGTRNRYQSPLRWYIMTSAANHDETVEFFQQNHCFGLPADDVVFFQQGMLPAFSPDGKILLAQKHRLAMSPDGHGGSLMALRESGALDDMTARGIEHISYFQVDNPLVKPLDELFIGLHSLGDSEMSSKCLPKAHDMEKVGNFCIGDGKMMVIEYSDMPEDLATAKNDDGSRKFDAGSIAIHLLARSFVERITTADLELPFHRAQKKVPHVGDNGKVIEPEEPNAVKLEQFVFDAIPMAENPIILQTVRSEEFSPVKNADGDDSPATSVRDQIRRAAAWLEHNGCRIPRNSDGEPVVPIEISPLLARHAHELTEADHYRDMEVPVDQAVYLE